MLVASWPTLAQTRASSQQAQTARFRLADTYMRAGQYERAVAMLEDLYDANPRNTVFFDKLKTAYVGLKRYDDAIRIVDQWIMLGPTPQLLAEKGSIQFQKGDSKSAYESWDRAIQLAPGDHRAYRSVYFMMSSNRLFDDAIAILEKGRVELGNPELFRLDLASMYGLLGRHDMAMSEYIGLVLQNPNQLGYVKRQLAKSTAQDSVFKLGVAAVERAVRMDPLNRAIRELAGWTYFESGRYRQALEAYQAIDRLEKEEGHVLFRFAVDVADAGAIDIADEALQMILDRYSDRPIAPLALFARGDINEREGQKLGERAADASGNPVPAPHFEKARETYQQFLDTFPNDPRYAEALQRLGDLQRTVFFDLPAAETTLTEVSRRFGSSAPAARARFNLGEIALERGDLQEARLIFSRLASSLEIGALAERCRFETARIDYYGGHFETALSIVSALDANTSTDISNDAIALKLLLRENKGPDSLNVPLTRFAHAELLLRRRMPVEALATLDSLRLSVAGHPLSDEVVFTNALALRQLDRYEDAVASLLTLSDLHPDSYLVDRALFTAAEIRERDLDDTEAALETYNMLLSLYPSSLLAPESRTRIRNLRGDPL